MWLITRFLHWSSLSLTCWKSKDMECDTTFWSACSIDANLLVQTVEGAELCDLSMLGLVGSQRRVYEEWRVGCPLYLVCDGGVQSQPSPCLPSSLCHCRHHLVPCVRPPWDHHRELWLLPLCGLDRSCALPRGWLCHRLLCWRCPVVWGKPFLLLFGLQLPHSCQECSCIRELPACQPRRCCGCWACGPRFAALVGETPPLSGSKAKGLEQHPLWHFVVLIPPPHPKSHFVALK